MNTLSFNSIKPLHLSSRSRNRRKGQIMVLFGLFMAFMVMGFLALALDFTMIYHTKAMLSRTVDATALRLVNRYSKQHSDSDRQRIAQSIFEANFDLLRKAETITWNWTSDGKDITSTAGETIIGLGKDSSGDVKYELSINTKADDETGVIVTNVSGMAEHDTLLLPYFSEDYEKFNFTENAETERFPSVNAIIIDLSGSMRGNDGAEGIVGTSSTKGAVLQFIEEFDEERDYMLLVGFANAAKVMWPPSPEGIDFDTGIPYFKPSRFFLTGTGVTPDAYGNKSMTEVIENNTAFSGWTNGGEGFRVAVQNVQHWLDNEPVLQNETVRSKIKVNYLFMTDGANNTARTFVKGHGYGINNNWNFDDSPPILSVHNTFHMEWPVVIADPDDLDGIQFEGEDLGDLLNDAVETGEDPRPENVPGIAACLYESAVNHGDNRYARSEESRSGNAEDWTGLLVKETGYTKGSMGPGDIGPNFDLRIEGTELLRWDPDIETKDDVAEEDPPYDDPDLWILQHDWNPDENEDQDDTEREEKRLRSSYFMIIPRTVSHDSAHDFLNPGLGWNYHDPAGSADNPTSLSVQNSDVSTETEVVQDDDGNNVTLRYHYIRRGTDTRYYFLAETIYEAYRNRFDNITDEDVKMTNVRANYFPIGEQYANHQGSFVEQNAGNPLGPDNSRTPHIFYAHQTWNLCSFVTQRISDFYPRYTFDGPPKQFRWEGADDDSTSSSGRSSERYYSFKDGGNWTTNLNPGSESNFLAGAQAKVARKRDANDPFKFQDATIYTVRYGGGGSVYMLKNMANDPLNQTSRFVSFPAENEGAYYDVNTGSTNLQAAFKNIASRIAVRISE